VIQLPRRSVTRFFIPLIDVLTLLFCIFLLMPLIKATGETQDAAGLDQSLRDSSISKQAGTPERTKLEQDGRDLERSRKERIKKLQENLYLRVLEIDADTGKLFYHDGERQREMRSQDDALKLIGAHRQEAGTRELYYLLLYPRRLTGFPQRAQVERYENWLRDVAHTIDNPRGEH